MRAQGQRWQNSIVLENWMAATFASWWRSICLASVTLGWLVWSKPIFINDSEASGWFLEDGLLFYGVKHPHLAFSQEEKNIFSPFARKLRISQWLHTLSWQSGPLNRRNWHGQAGQSGMCLVKSERKVSTLSNTGALQCLFGECNLWNRTLGISRNLPSSAGWSWPGTCESTTLKVATCINSKMADLSKGMSITNCRARGHPKTILHPRTEPPLFCRVACWRFRWEVNERTLHFSNQRLGRRCVDSMVFGVAWHSKWPKFSTPTKLGMGCIGIFLSAPVIHPRLCAKSNLENFDAQSWAATPDGQLQAHGMARLWKTRGCFTTISCLIGDPLSSKPPMIEINPNLFILINMFTH